MATVLIIGDGGREHALARSLADDADVDRVLCAPGNAGTEALAGVFNVPQAEPSDLIALAAREAVDLVVAGAEQPLMQGAADELRRRGLRVFGFGQRTAQLAASSICAKRFMERNGIPTPSYRVFTHPNPALTYLEAVWAESPQQPFVIQAEEPCYGRGRRPVRTVREAERALQRLLADRECGVGDHVVIEEGVRGEDVSLAALTDGETLVTTPPVHVHRRLADGETGPGTPGMGAHAPATALNEQVYGRVEAEILLPTLDGWHAERATSAGAWDLGLRIDPKGKPYALTYGASLGDPQAQALLALLGSDLYPVLSACADGRLDLAELRWREGTAVSVVACVSGYPDQLTHQGEPITGLAEVERLPNVTVDQHGTDLRRGQLVTRGGRVLTITGLGADGTEARERAYDAIERIRFRGMRYRADIGESVARRT